jgi:hypothetical protein
MTKELTISQENESNIDSILAKIFVDNSKSQGSYRKLETTANLLLDNGTKLNVTSTIEYIPIASTKELIVHEWEKFQTLLILKNNDNIVKSCIELYKYLKIYLSDNLSIVMCFKFDVVEHDIDKINIKVGAIKKSSKRKRE